MAAVNTGVMLLRPDVATYEAMLESYASRALWTGTSRWSGQPWNATGPALTVAPGAAAGAASAALSAEPPAARVGSELGGAMEVSGSWRADLEEQDWRNEFLALHMDYRGQLGSREAPGREGATPGFRAPFGPAAAAVTAQTAGAPCDAERPWLRRYLAVAFGVSAEDGEGEQRRSGDDGGGGQRRYYCTLPAAFNFCATAPCLRWLAASVTGAPVQAVELPRDTTASATAAAAFAEQAAEAAAAGTVPSTSPALLLGAKILHWPGALRKPWQRCAPAARSALDDLWWQAYEAACASAPPRAPCSIRC